MDLFDAPIYEVGDTVAKVSIFATIRISGAIVDFPVAKVCCIKKRLMLYILPHFHHKPFINYSPKLHFARILCKPLFHKRLQILEVLKIIQKLASIIKETGLPLPSGTWTEVGTKKTLSEIFSIPVFNLIMSDSCKSSNNSETDSSPKFQLSKSLSFSYQKRSPSRNRVNWSAKIASFNSPRLAFGKRSSDNIPTHRSISSTLS